MENEWTQKQDDFLHFLEKHNADKAPYRVDLEKRKIYWVDERDLSLAVADCKVILSFALSNNSIMMGWANRSLPPGTAIEAIEGMTDIYPDCDEYDVWELSMQVASSVNADAIYRTPSPQSWVMLALWNLRPGGAEQFSCGSPSEHVMRVVRNLLEHVEFEDRSVLLDNYAESFLQMASHPYKGTDYAERLRNTARDFRNLLASATEESQNEGLHKISSQWKE